jgi:hypothetical protein
MSEARTHATTGGRGIVGRFVHDEDGHLRTVRILVCGGALAVLTAVGTLAALVAAGSTSPGLVAVAVLGALLVIKLPILVVVWRAMGRHLESPGETRWSDEDVTQILERLRQESTRAAGRADSGERLRHLSEEAWYVADHVPDRHRSEAVSVAVEIAGRAGRAGSGVS